MTLQKRILLPIGVHLNTDAVHMIQLEQAENNLAVASKASRYFTPAAGSTGGTPSKGELPAHLTNRSAEARSEEGREFVRQTIASDGFRGKEIVLSLPAEHLVIQHVRMAPMPSDELVMSLPVELHGKLPFDPREAVLRHIVAGSVSENNEPKQDVIALAIRRSVIETHFTAFSKLGLHVVGIGVEPCAMCYPYIFAAGRAAPSPDSPTSTMLVYLGSKTTHVSIVRGMETTFVKGVELGTDQLVEAIAKTHNISAEEAVKLRAAWCQSPNPETLQEAVAVYNAVRQSLGPIVDEIESCMRYHASLARGAHINRLIFLGSEARDRALVRVLGAHLSVPCEIGDPLTEVVGSNGRKTEEPEMAVALGLGLFAAP